MHTIKRWTVVLFSCPIRCTLLIACNSAAGLSSGSTRITCCASNKLRPFAPCWTNINSTWIGSISDWQSCRPLPFRELLSPLKRLIAICDLLKNNQLKHGFREKWCPELRKYIFTSNDSQGLQDLQLCFPGIFKYQIKNLTWLKKLREDRKRCEEIHEKGLE